MKFEIGKQDFLAALEVASTSVASSGNDISTHFLFRAKGDPGAKTLEVLTYGGRLFGSTPLPKAVLEDESEPLAFTIESKRLLKWMEAVPDAPLLISFTGGEATCVTPKGSMDFPSLDPGNFPYFDKRLADVKLGATVQASKLLAAITCTKEFNSKDNAAPDQAVSEVRGGRLMAGDRKTVTSVTVDAIAKTALRIHNSDCGAIQKFLSFAGDDEVEILEHDNSTVYRAKSGALLGNTRFRAQFPDVPVPPDSHLDQMVWEVSKASMEWAIKFLAPGAEEKDTRLRFTQASSSDTSIQVWMTTQSGKDKSVSLELISTSKVDPSTPDIPPSGFTISHEFLTKVLKAWDGDKVRVGINLKGAGGYLRFYQEKGGDKYQTVMVWLRK